MIHKEVRDLERFLAFGPRANDDSTWTVIRKVHITKMTIGDWEREEPVVIDKDPVKLLREEFCCLVIPPSEHTAPVGKI